MSVGGRALQKPQKNASDLNSHNFQPGTGTGTGTGTLANRARKFG
jgi:hypothetical protein